jgi:hypothetical protein
MIVKRNNKWCLLSKQTRRNLGCYPTREDALRRERQVQFFKRRSGGFSGPNLVVIGKRSDDAITHMRREAERLLEEAYSIEQAWRKWNLDDLVRLGVISPGLAEEARKELDE